jgi:hypothetical protein
MRPAHAAALAFALMALAGCGLTSEATPTAWPTARGGVAEPVAARAGAETALAARPSPPRAVNEDPASLLGLNEEELRRQLGQPAFMRRDIPALLWRYAARDCTLDVFLYRNGTSGPFTVTHLAARSTDGVRSLAAPAAGAEINPRVCLGAVLRARAPSAPPVPTS